MVDWALGSAALASLASMMLRSAICKGPASVSETCGAETCRGGHA